MINTFNQPSEKILAIFSCDQYQANALCQYITKEFKRIQVDCLILEKQVSVNEIIQKYSFNRIVINEHFYGQITNGETYTKLKEIACQKYKMSIFPLNTFNANIFLLASSITPLVRAVNLGYSGKEQIVIDLISKELNGGKSLPEYNFSGWPEWAHSLQLEMQQRLRESESRVTQVRALSQGERPVGFMDSPNETESFVRYLTAANLCRDCDVVEVGAGIGYGAYILASQAHTVIGVEKDSISLQSCREIWEPLSTNLRYKMGDALNLDFENESVDRIVCFEVLEHVANPQEMIKELFRLIRPGGTLILSTPNPYWFYYRVNTQETIGQPVETLLKKQIWPWHLSGITPNQAIEMALDSGFSFSYLLYPTYVEGFKTLSQICQTNSIDLRLTKLKNAMNWTIDDFVLTNEFSPWFSSYSYVMVAHK